MFFVNDEKREKKILFDSLTSQNSWTQIKQTSVIHGEILGFFVMAFLPIFYFQVWYLKLFLFFFFKFHLTCSSSHIQVVKTSLEVISGLEEHLSFSTLFKFSLSRRAVCCTSQKKVSKFIRSHFKWKHNQKDAFWSLLDRSGCAIRNKSLPLWARNLNPLPKRHFEWAYIFKQSLAFCPLLAFLAISLH